MSLESILMRLQEALDVLRRRAPPEVEQDIAPRARTRTGARKDDAPPLPKAGFSDEALPWMEAVHRFALRLVTGDEERAADLVQDTFLRAYRAWESFERGTNCRSWLFTICKNLHLQWAQRAHVRREIREADLDVDIDAIGVRVVSTRAEQLGVDESFFEQLLDERVVDEIDALPDEFRDVIVLSDLGDLNYAEIATVLDLPIGTVKSRLFRARRRLQDSLLDYAVNTGLIQDDGQ